MVEGNGEMSQAAAGGVGGSESQHGLADTGKQIVKKKFVPDVKPALFQPGMLQDLMSEVGWGVSCTRMCVRVLPRNFPQA